MPMAFRVMNNWLAFAVLVIIGTLPIWGVLLPPAEGAIFPVTSTVEWREVTPATDGGVTFRFAYTKHRQCEFVNVVMVDPRGRDAALDLVDKNAPPPSTLLVGEQVSRVWHADLASLGGVSLFFIHRCPFIPWLTTTQAAP